MSIQSEKIITIPNIVTLLNLISGLSSIFISALGNLSLAYVLILIAATFDAFDGLIARKIGQESSIGRELDSLADIVAFGVGPAMLILKRALFNSLYLIPASFFVVCGALRLAKFNLYGTKEFFEGLPIPAAAILTASMVIYFPIEITGWLYFMIGYLMISPIVYPSIKTDYGRNSVAISVIIGLILFSFMVITSNEFLTNSLNKLEDLSFLLATILLYLSFLYALISPTIFYKIRGKTRYRSVKLQNVS